MLANLMLASEPRACPLSLLKIFFSLRLLQHIGGLLASSPVFEVYSAFEVFIPLLKCLFLTKTIACRFSLGREVMVLCENTGKTNA